MQENADKKNSKYGHFLCSASSRSSNPEVIFKSADLQENSTIRYNTITTQLNTSTKEARVAKIGLYIALFVTELYFF